MAKRIPLPCGRSVLVDDEDYERFKNYPWHYTRGHASYSAPDNGGNAIYLHRLIMEPGDGEEVDHINGNGLDNRRINLRVCTHAQNMKNRKKRSSPTSSIYKGVSWHKREQRWIARIYSDGTCHHLGYHDEEVEAAKAYNRAARELHGEFCNLNPIPEPEREKPPQTRSGGELEALFSPLFPQGG